MAFRNYISFSSWDNFGELIVQFEKHCVALELLLSEATEPQREKETMDCIYGLLWDRLTYLERTLSDMQMFYSAVCDGESYGPQGVKED